MRSSGSEAFRAQQVYHLLQAVQVARPPRIQYDVLRINLVTFLGQPGLQVMEVAQHYFSREHLTHAPDERRKLGREGRMLLCSRGEEQELLPNQVIKGSLFPVSGLDYGCTGARF